MNNQKEHVEVLKTNSNYLERIACDLRPWTKPFKCAVASCQNYFHKYINNELPYKFHDFPQDSTLKNVWLEKCSLLNNVKVESIKVCSDHFLLEHYDRNYKEEFKNPNYRRPLKASAIPTEKLSGIVIPMVLETDIKEIININEVKIAIDNNEALKEDLKVMKEKEVELRTKLDQMGKKNKLKIMQAKALKRSYALLKKRIGNKEHKNIISKVFSDAQVNILKGQHKTFWSDDDLAMAFTLRQMSSKFCYLYLKNTLNIPLPALSCVQKWAASK